MTGFAFIFPGQGCQYVGMGQSFLEHYAIARQTFEEASDILGEDFAKLVLEGPIGKLTETQNSQAAIFIVSIAILRVIRQLFPTLTPKVTAGLSLGEYTALTAAGCLSFAETLPLVAQRGKLMASACEEKKGAMAVVLGMTAEEVERLVDELGMKNDLWVANYNCPGQVVLSGTLKGIQAGSEEAKKRGCKKVLALQVHGAFHSGLMQTAQNQLSDWIYNAPFRYDGTSLVMNVTGKPACGVDEIRENLIKQVTQPVKWEQSIRTMNQMGVNCYVEIGPSKTLAGFGKRIEGTPSTVSIETVDGLKTLEKEYETLLKRVK